MEQLDSQATKALSARDREVGGGGRETERVSGVRVTGELRLIGRATSRVACNEPMPRFQFVATRT